MNLQEKFANIMDSYDMGITTEDPIARIQEAVKALGGRSFYSLTRRQRLEILKQILPRNYENYRDRRKVFPFDDDCSDEDKITFVNAYFWLNKSLQDFDISSYDNGSRFEIDSIYQEYNKMAIITTKPRGVSTKRIKQNTEIFTQYLRNKSTDKIHVEIDFNADKVVLRIRDEDAIPLLLGDIYIQKEIEEAVAKYIQPVCIGVTGDGTPIIQDLSQLHHGIISGNTNGGKSFSATSIIQQLLWFNSPEELQIIGFDPKNTPMLIGFNKAPHSIVITKEHDNLQPYLTAILAEVDRRMEYLTQFEVNDIEEYNELRKTRPDLKPVPYVLWFIDEINSLVSHYDKDEYAKIKMDMATVVSKSRAAGIKQLMMGQKLMAEHVKREAVKQCGFNLALLLTDVTQMEYILGEKMVGYRMTAPGDAAVKFHGDAPIPLRTGVIHTSKKLYQPILKNLLELISVNTTCNVRVDELEQFRLNPLNQLKSDNIAQNIATPAQPQSQNNAVVNEMLQSQTVLNNLVFEEEIPQRQVYQQKETVVEEEEDDGKSNDFVGLINLVSSVGKYPIAQAIEKFSPKAITRAIADKDIVINGCNYIINPNTLPRTKEGMYAYFQQHGEVTREELQNIFGNSVLTAFIAEYKVINLSGNRLKLKNPT